MSGIQHPRKSSVSLVIPIYNEADGIATTLKEIAHTLKAITIDKEIVVVDDGSSDGTWVQLQKLHPLEVKIKLIRLSRNFGKEPAIMAGIDHCSGDAVIILDGDLQHPPELLVEMIKTWRSEDVDIIDGIKQERRSEPPLNQITSSLNHRLFRSITG